MLLLDYNESNGRVRNVRCENGTAFACWGAVRVPDTGEWIERTFPPNAVTNQVIPAGVIDVVIVEDSEIPGNFFPMERKDDNSLVNLETQFRFPA